MFSPALLHTDSSSRRLAVQLASELGCSDDDKMAACLRATPSHALNAAQTKVQFKQPQFYPTCGESTSDPCVCVCAAAGGQRSVSVLVSGPSVRLSVFLPQSRPAAGDVPTRRLDQPSSRAEGQRSHTHTCCATECTPPLAVLIRASFDLRSGLRGSAGAS